MTNFAFESIHTLELSKDDRPMVDVKDGRILITATRRGERILISAPLSGNEVVPSVRSLSPAVTAVKVSSSANKARPYIPNGRTGENNALAKLTEEQVREIRAMIKDPDILKTFNSTYHMYVEMGRIYKVHPATISNIVRNISWKHVVV